MKKTLSFHRRTVGRIQATQIITISHDEPLDAVQTSLFQQDSWESEMIETMRRRTVFYPSEIRIMCGALPPTDNAIGPFFKKLMFEKKIERTGNYRNSMCSSRRGSVEFEYKNLMN